MATVNKTTSVPSAQESDPESQVDAETRTCAPDTPSMKQRYDALITSRQTLITSLKQEIQELRKMQRDQESALRIALKATNKRKKAPRDDSNPRKPTGFAAPMVVSDELYTFLEQYGVKRNEPIARTKVTRFVHKYIKEHNLQNQTIPMEICPDETLQSLLGEPQQISESGNKVVTYLHLQTYLTPHFSQKQFMTNTDDK